MDPTVNEYIGAGNVRAQTRRTLENGLFVIKHGWWV